MASRLYRTTCQLYLSVCCALDRMPVVSVGLLRARPPRHLDSGYADIGGLDRLERDWLDPA
jgi:hypothetical protein